MRGRLQCSRREVMRVMYPVYGLALLWMAYTLMRHIWPLTTSSQERVDTSASLEVEEACVMEQVRTDRCHRPLHNFTWWVGKGLCPSPKPANGTGKVREVVHVWTAEEREEKFTVVINAHSSRLHLLQKVLRAYDGAPRIREIIIVWGPPNASVPSASELGMNRTRCIVMNHFERDSLNSRFSLDVLNQLHTEAVLANDDDIYFHEDGLEYAFRMWQRNRQSIVGVTPRLAWGGKGERKYAIPGATNCGLNLILTNLAFISTNMMRAYAEPRDGPIAAMREHVDAIFNCEDIAMNFITSHQFGPPVQVKNIGWTSISHRNGLSLRPSHVNDRSQCLNIFESFYDTWPLQDMSTHLPSY